MLLVKTKIGVSKIHGIGLFAAQKIKKGMQIWKMVPEYDKLIPEEEVHQMDEPQRSFIYNFAYLNPYLKMYVLEHDNGRFINHDALNPNVIEGENDNDFHETTQIASRDIEDGEELTCDYRMFDADSFRKIGVPHLMEHTRTANVSR